MSNEILNIKNLSVGYGSNIILQSINLNIIENNTYCLIGENGSGKSTLLKAIIGIEPSKNGSIYYSGIDITHLPINNRVNLGMTYLGQTNHVFSRLKIKDHIKLATQDTNSNMLTVLQNYFPDFIKLYDSYAGTLSGGQQRLLGLFLVLMNKKEFIILDELFAGVSLDIQEKMLEVLANLKSSTTILMVEQNEKIIKNFKGIKIDINELKK